MAASVYLIPNVLAEHTHASVFPANLGERIRHIRHFAVEDPKSARSLLKYWGLPLQELELYSMHVKKGDISDIMDLMAVCAGGEDIGILSDAGLPAIADPGENIVLLAHKKGYRVVPLVGPGSIFLALAGSGLNGEKFMFHGYLPKDESGRSRELKRLETDCHKYGTTHIFIETPYRNNALWKNMMQQLRPDTRICVACMLTAGDEEYVQTRSVAEWKKIRPDFDHKPAVFLLGS